MFLKANERVINYAGLNCLSGDREFIELLPLSEKSKRMFFQDGVYRIE